MGWEGDYLPLLSCHYKQLAVRLFTAFHSSIVVSLNDTQGIAPYDITCIIYLKQTT